MVSQVMKKQGQDDHKKKKKKFFSTIDRNIILYREPNNVLEDSLRKSNGCVEITTQISALKNLPSFVTF